MTTPLYPQAKPELPTELLLRLYEEMLCIRLLDERAHNLQRSGRVGFLVANTGEEAAQIGTVAALEPTDWLFPSYRQVGCLLHRGYSLDSIMSQLFGAAGDVTKGRQMPCHYSSKAHRFVSISSVIGTQIIQAAGCGIAAKLRGEPVVTMAYMGDGATSANDFHSGLNFAGVFKAPVVFVCVNNQYAISLPVARQTAVKALADKAEAYGVHGERVDGADIQGIYVAASQAVERARRGDGPTLLEVVTYRRGPHSSSDDVSRYRSADELADWEDPIAVTRKILADRNVWSDEQEKALVDRLQSLINHAATKAQQTPPPPPETLFDDVYAVLPPHLQVQQTALLAELQRNGSTAADVGEFPL